MSAPDLEKDTRALLALNAWAKLAPHHWAVASETCEETVFVHVNAGPAAGPVRASMFFLPGFAAFKALLLLVQAPNQGHAIAPIDIPHWELLVLADGTFRYQSCTTGYVPQPLSDAEKAILAPILHECLGLFMRFEEDGSLAQRYADRNALFMRREGLDGKWRDQPFVLPKEAPPEEQTIALDPKSVARGAALPFADGEEWEVDFIVVPGMVTPEPRPRYLYLFAAVDKKTLKPTMWARMSVAEGSLAGLKALWESLAQHLLTAIVRHGAIPGSVAVRSDRMARVLRPLGLNIPFRLVQHAHLKALEGVLQTAARQGRF